MTDGKDSFPIHNATAKDSSQLLSKAAGDVSSILHSQLQTLEETKKISQAVPALQQGTQEASTWIKVILESVKSFPNASEDIFNIKENVQTLKRLALGKICSILSYVTHCCSDPRTLADDQLHKTQKTQNSGKQKLFDWLSSLDFRPKQLDIFSRRSPSTGEWLLEDDKFQVWLQGEGPSCMWCSGIRKHSKKELARIIVADKTKAGAGKTVLASVLSSLVDSKLTSGMSRSIVINDLQSNPPVSGTAVAYIYFDYKNKDTHNVLAVFSNILRQLLEQLNIIPREIQELYDSISSERKENNLNIDQCFSFIQLVCKDFARTFLIFDALDECPVHDSSSNEFRSKMVSLIQRLSQLTTIFVTSRPHVNLTLEIRNCGCLDVQATDSDMCAYLKARAANHKILRRIIDQNPALENHLVDTICSKAKGM